MLPIIPITLPCVVSTVTLAIIGNGEIFFLLIFRTDITGATCGAGGGFTFGGDLVRTVGGGGDDGDVRDDCDGVTRVLLVSDDTVDDTGVAEDTVDTVDGDSVDTVRGIVTL